MPRVVALLVLLTLILLPHATVAVVHRCALPSGGTAYTDRKCEELGAVERAPSAAQSQPQLRSTRTTCSRTLRDLAYELSAAIEAHDVNRLAGVYHWAGLSTRQGYATMSRLQAIADRPLVDLQPMYPRSLDADFYPQAAASRPPTGLRLSQVSKNGSTPIDTVLGLRRHLDCWWVSDGRFPTRSASPIDAKRARAPADAEPPPAPLAPADVPLESAQPGG